VVISLACVSSSKSFEGSERSFLAAKLIYVVAGGNSRVDVKEHPQDTRISHGMSYRPKRVTDMKGNEVMIK